MLEAIERLLVLQDRDRKILRTRAELADIEPQRRLVLARLDGIRGKLKAAKDSANHLESQRKQLELDVEAQKQQINRYSGQQSLTKKNEEYRALMHEIGTCRAAISQLEDRQLELMERIEQAQREAVAYARELADLEREVNAKTAELAAREIGLKQELGDLVAGRGGVASSVEPVPLARYERLLKHKGENVVVGIHRGVCGGCHMRVPVQIFVTCQADEGVVTCPNCGRILYYTPDMEPAGVE
jgi:hypothetical protein